MYPVEADRVRDAARRGVHGPVQYGAPPAVVVASGRSTCRACGQRIAKGEPQVSFMWDFNGCGSWTATTAALHVVCPEVRS